MNEDTSNQVPLHDEADKEFHIFDRIMKENVELLSEPMLNAFLSGAYQREIPPDAPIQRLSTESNTEARRTADLFFRVDGHMYNMEIQSSDGKDMALRMFDYGFRGAKLHGNTKGHDIHLSFPHPVVLYLRSGKNTPKELKVTVEFPHIEKTVDYTVPTLHLKDMTAREILDRKLLPLVSFYPMKCESIYVSNEDFAEEIKTLCQGVYDLHKAGLLSETDCADIDSKIRAILNHSLPNSKNKDLKEVEIVNALETVAYNSVHKMVRNAKAEGEAKGEAKGAEKSLRTALRYGMTIEIAQKVAAETGISPARTAIIIQEETEAAGEKAAAQKPSLMEKMRNNQEEIRKTSPQNPGKSKNDLEH